MSSSDSQFCDSPGFLLEASEEEWIKRARELTTLLLAEAALVQAFKGRWMMICMRVQCLSEALDSVCESSSLQQSFVHHKSTLSQIVGSLVDGRELAQMSISLTYGGKLLMQSNLDALVTKLDNHLRDLNEVKDHIKQQERTLAITKVMASDRNSESHSIKNLKKEQVWCMFAQLRAGNVDVKKSVLESLIDHMCEDDKAALLVTNEGDVFRLIQLLDSSSPGIRERAVHAVSIMAMLDECKKTLIAEGAIQPLLRVLEFGNARAKDRAALALAEFTCIAENAHAVASQDGAISLLVKLCKQGTPAVMTAAAATLCNLARNEHIRRALADNGVVDTLIALLTCSSDGAGQHAAKALLNLASGRDDKIRTFIARHGGMQSLLMFLKHAVSPDAQEVAIQALGKLATSAASVKVLVSAGYVTQLAELLNTGSSSTQHLAAIAIHNLSSHMDMKSQTCPTPLIRMLEARDISEQKVAAHALSNVKGSYYRDERHVLGILDILTSCKHSLTKKFSLSAMLTISSTSMHKRRIMLAEVQPQSAPGPNKPSQRTRCKKLLGIFTKNKPPLSSSS
ncbi:hypothetical protein L7F22_020409 [Adiantum nelumboides]|nr:hypothetical protein [Adiantum nelumboides]